MAKGRPKGSRNLEHREVKCPDCNETDLSKFSKNSSHWKGVQSYCRACQRRRKYGLTPDGYAAMLAEQKGLCAACHKPPVPSTGSARGNAGDPLVIDHDHVTGKIRGLIHGSCNRVLGQAKDDVSVLAGAIEYLIKHKTLGATA